MKQFLLILVVLAVIGAGVVEWANAAWNQPGPPARSGNQTVILIAPRTGVHAITQQLQDAGVLKYGLMFEFDLRVRGLAGQVKAGEYAVPAHASMAQIAAILVAGKSIEHKLTAAEGLTSDMIWKLVKSDPVLVGNAGPVPGEGTLLPETYLFTRGETRAQLLYKMRQAQQAFLDAHWDARAEESPVQSKEEAVILASIVEKETALPQERRHIAGLFLNRLTKGMQLQSDPTIIYGLTKGYPLGHGIRESELQSRTPYNTYVITGLPPTPIANPGKDSIAAVLNPDKTDDLYFVANGTGGHSFSATMAEHEKNVAVLRALERRSQTALPPVATPVVSPQIQPRDVTATAPLPDAPPLPTLPKPVVRRRHHHAT